MNITLKRAIRIICFFLVLVLLWTGVTYLCTPKDKRDDGISKYKAQAFWAEPENSLDIFMTGNSNCAEGFSPLELWNLKGYTSYVSGEPWQDLAMANFMLEKFLQCQNPKLVILETDGMFSSGVGTILSTYVYHEVPIMRYHDRWKNIGPGQAVPDMVFDVPYIYRGQIWSQAVEPYTKGEYMIPTEARMDVPFTAVYFMDKFVETCKENGAEVLLLQVPSAKSWSYSKHNAVSDYAKEKGLKFLDFNLLTEEIGLDWATDSRDAGNHLNVFGAQKVTAYLADYIEESFDIPSHKGEQAFARWDEDYLTFKEDIALGKEA